MTRQQALAAGLKIYFIGKACPQGHVAMRRVSGACCECARLLRQDYVKANPGQARAWKSAEQKRNRAAAKRRAAKVRQMPAWADKEKIQRIYDEAARMRASGLDVHVDHVIPLQGRTVSGLHVHTNLEIIGAQLNRSKSNQLTL